MPSLEKQLWMYERMFTARYYDEQMVGVYLEGKQPVFNMGSGPVPGEMHLSIGQEPCAAGVCAHLADQDVVTATHRPHHVAIAKGVDLKAMTAEIFGKKAGLSGGRGGHMHLFDTNVNFSCTGIVGEGIAPAVGAAMARKMRGEDGVAVAFIGEGAVNQGTFHEAMNLAGLWKLPFVCIIEDNSYGISVSKADTTAVATNDVRAAAYNMPGERVENNDPVEIYRAAGRAIDRARSGGGPSLIEIETFRFAGHFIGDPEGYRPEGEKEKLFAADSLAKMRETLSAETDIDEMETRAKATVDAAYAYAREMDYPDVSDALDCVFV